MVTGVYKREMLLVIDKAEYTKNLQESVTNRELKTGKVIAGAALCSYHGGGQAVLV